MRQALCAGLFHNVAQAAEGQNHFRTMEGQASVVLVHPSSAYFGEAQKTLKWVVYFEVVWTSQVGWWEETACRREGCLAVLEAAGALMY